MNTAQQARENSYDKTISWCERKIQPEIEAKIGSIEKIEKMASKMFYASEVEIDKLKSFLEQCGYKVVICNMTKQAGFISMYEDIYNITVYW